MLAWKEMVCIMRVCALQSGYVDAGCVSGEI